MNRAERLAQYSYQIFSKSTKRILAATNLAVRNIDVDRVDIGVNYDVPTPPPRGSCGRARQGAAHVEEASR